MERWPFELQGGRTEPPANWRSLLPTGVRALPDDYRDLVGEFGVGSIDGFLHVLVPGCENENLDMLKQVGPQREAVRDLVDAGASIPAWAMPEQLIAWGVSDNGDVCFWLSRGAPQEWPIVVCDGRMCEWELHEGGLFAFLKGLSKRTVRSNVFEDGLTEHALKFVPWVRP